MNGLKSVLLLTVLLSLGFSSHANGRLDLADTYKSTPENTAHILTVARSRLGEPDLISLLRIEDLNQAPNGSPFTITYPSRNTADVSWNLTGTGFDLSAVYIFGGSNGANLYRVADPEQMLSGSAVIHPPVTGKSGEYAAISHTLFLGVAVPEPTSGILLVLGVAALLVSRSRRP